MLHLLRDSDGILMGFPGMRQGTSLMKKASPLDPFGIERGSAEGWMWPFAQAVTFSGSGNRPNVTSLVRVFTSA